MATKATAASIEPLGDAGLLIRFGDMIDPQMHQQVRALALHLDEHPLPGVLEHVPAYATLAVFYEPTAWTFEAISGVVDEAHHSLTPDFAAPHRSIEIPVCYDAEFGPDLESVARHCGLAADEVIHLHSSGQYLAYMIGFVPGFPYLGGLPAAIACPRLPSPRLRVPAGSVAIGGSQTGIYPLETPGGWRIIGRTPRLLFRPEVDPPTLLEAGDIVTFRAISREQFDAWQEPPP